MKQVEKIMYWTSKVLPTVYDDSLSYMELLNKVIERLNEVIDNSNELQDVIYQTVEFYIQAHIDDFKIKPVYNLAEERIYFDGENAVVEASDHVYTEATSTISIVGR